MIGVNTDAINEQKLKGNMEISASDYWFKNLRPYMSNMLMTCRTDRELTRTLEKDINSIDSEIIRAGYDAVDDDLDPLQKVISSDQYYASGPLRYAPEAEKEAVRMLLNKIKDFKLILQYEKPDKPKEPKVRERLNYSPIGEGSGMNNDYMTRNMESLNKTPENMQRLPNS